MIFKIKQYVKELCCEFRKKSKFTCKVQNLTLISPRPFLLSSILPFWLAMRSYRPHLEERDSIWDNDWPAPLSDGLLAKIFGVFLSCKTNARRSVHSHQDHFIITLISDRRDWRDTRGKWFLARNPDRSCWHTRLKFFLS